MSLEETELKVGGVKFKGIYFAIFATVVSSVGGVIWGASEFYSQINQMQVEIEDNADSIPNIAPLTERISVLEDRLNSMTIPDITDLEKQMATNVEAIQTIRVNIAGLLIPDLGPVEVQLSKIETMLRDEAFLDDLNLKVSSIEQDLSNNNISQLQGKLAELGTNLATIMEDTKVLMDLRETVREAQGQVVVLGTKVDSATRFAEEVSRLQDEVEDLWQGLDAVANPLN